MDLEELRQKIESELKIPRIIVSPLVVNRYDDSTYVFHIFFVSKPAWRTLFDYRENLYRLFEKLGFSKEVWADNRPWLEEHKRSKKRPWSLHCEVNKSVVDTLLSVSTAHLTEQSVDLATASPDRS